MLEWDNGIEGNARAALEGTGDEELVRRAQAGNFYVVIELARRALHDHALLGPALAAVDHDHTWRPKSFPPFGWYAALRILVSDDTAAKAALLEVVKTWDAWDQERMFQVILPRGRRNAELCAVAEEFNWTPGFMLVD